MLSSCCSNGSQVTVTTDPTTGCMTVVVDGVPSTICPGGGSDVSIVETPTAFVLTIDGVPTIIPKGDEIECDPLGIRINGVLCPFPVAGASTRVTYDAGTGVYTAVNSDGTIVNWRDENSVTTGDFNAVTNEVTIANPDGSVITFLAGVDSPRRDEFDPHYGNDGTTVLFYAPTSI